MVEKSRDMPPRVSDLKQLCEEVLGHPLDAFQQSGRPVWEFRYVNRSGVHLFSIFIRDVDGSGFRIHNVTGVKSTGSLVELN